MYNRSQHLHFIGIGGVGMAGIAEILLNLGYSVGGSDVRNGHLVEHLSSLGAKIAIGHALENLRPETSVVVYSSAVKEDNPEMVAARGKGIPVIRRAEMLAELMRMKYGLAIAGSHGKTTTTSMTGKLLADAGYDPTVIVGGKVKSASSGALLGHGDFMVTEADESDGSFLLLRPAIAVVTNIDFEHMTHYGSFAQLEQSFREFMESVPFYGLVIACFDDPVVRRLCQNFPRRVMSYGLSTECDLCASNIETSADGSEYDVSFQGQSLGRFFLPVAGVHMVKNSLASIAAGIELGVFADEMRQSLASFPGVARRLETLYQGEQAMVIDDYGHHPTEIRATLDAVRRAYGKERRIVTVFQPHRYTRTQELFAEFLESFSATDVLLVTDVYSAGEERIAAVEADKLTQAIAHSEARYSGDLEQTFSQLLEVFLPGDIVVTLGAGSVTTLGHRFASWLSRED